VDLDARSVDRIGSDGASAADICADRAPFTSDNDPVGGGDGRGGGGRGGASRGGGGRGGGVRADGGLAGGLMVPGA
jgi:hypothetical protein